KLREHTTAVDAVAAAIEVRNAMDQLCHTLVLLGGTSPEAPFREQRIKAAGQALGLLRKALRSLSKRQVEVRALWGKLSSEALIQLDFYCTNFAWVVTQTAASAPLEFAEGSPPDLWVSAAAGRRDSLGAVARHVSTLFDTIESWAAPHLLRSRLAPASSR